jgi:hypothetical protein
MAEQAFQPGRQSVIAGIGVFRRAEFRVASAQEDAPLFGRKQRKDLPHGPRLGCGADKRYGFPMQGAGGMETPDAQRGAGEEFVHTVAYVGQGLHRKLLKPFRGDDRGRFQIIPSG